MRSHDEHVMTPHEASCLQQREGLLARTSGVLRRSGVLCTAAPLVGSTGWQGKRGAGALRDLRPLTARLLTVGAFGAVCESDKLQTSARVKDLPRDSAWGRKTTIHTNATNRNPNTHTAVNSVHIRRPCLICLMCTAACGCADQCGLLLRPLSTCQSVASCPLRGDLTCTLL